MPIHDWSLADAGIFHHFHLTWIARLHTLLNERVLPQPCYALAEAVLGETIPDVITLEARSASSEAGGEYPGLVREDSPQGVVALAPSPVVVQDLGPAEPYALLARRIAIRDRLRGDRVVSVIELVSRANKTSKTRVEQFLARSVELLQKGIHLLIIDLQPPTAVLPHGFHQLICDAYGNPPPKLPEGRILQAVSYEVLQDGGIRSHLVPLRVGDRLPEMPVFLLLHRFVRLPLEASYGEAFAAIPRPFREALGG